MAPKVTVRVWPNDDGRWVFDFVPNPDARALFGDGGFDSAAQARQGLRRLASMLSSAHVEVLDARPDDTDV